MNAIKFPDMISNNETNVIYDKDATHSNLKNLLLSVKQTLLGDPYFGINLQKLLYEKNNIIIQDLVIDEIYNAITIFMPQIRVERKNIQIIAGGNKIALNLQLQNMLDYSFNEYTINLLNVESI